MKGEKKVKKREREIEGKKMLHVREVAILEKDREDLMMADSTPDATTATVDTLESNLKKLSANKYGLTLYTALSTAIVSIGFIVVHSLHFSIGIVAVCCIVLTLAVALLFPQYILTVTNGLLNKLPTTNTDSQKPNVT